MQTKSKGKGEPGKIHVKNVIGRENLHAKVVAEALSVAGRMGLGGTTLHYLAVWHAIVSVHRPVHSKIMLTLFRPSLRLLFRKTDCQNRLLLYSPVLHRN